MRRFILMILIVALLMCYLSTAVLANSPGPSLETTPDEKSPLGIILAGEWILIIAYLVLTGLTCWIEWLVAGPFGFRSGYETTILLTNVITQLGMHSLEFLTLQRRPSFVNNPLLWYIAVVAILEVLVYVIEFLIYRRKMQNVPRKRILLYTLCANTASLLGGLLLLFILI